jgi:hypothetical protein
VVTESCTCAGVAVRLRAISGSEGTKIDVENGASPVSVASTAVMAREEGRSIE